ncbi:MAG: replication-relaxation family protein [Dehalococcoidia bacterium]|nr:replication-relaxation family protein [Dehalococcoidia bacterium]
MPATTRFTPTPRDLAILSSVRVHRRLTATQVRRLFFRGVDGSLAAPQTVHARLRRLIQLGYLDVLVVDGGRGAGPYAYGITVRGLHTVGASARPRGNPGPVLHDLQLAELRVNMQLGLEAHGGELVEWVGEGDLRSLLRGSGAPRPDGLCHWRMGRQHGVVLFELDRGTEPFAALTQKLFRYRAWFRTGTHRELVTGLPLRPRVAVVAPKARARRLVAVLRSVRSQAGVGVFVAPLDDAVRDPLGRRWWRRDDLGRLEGILDA